MFSGVIRGAYVLRRYLARRTQAPRQHGIRRRPAVAAYPGLGQYAVCRRDVHCAVCRREVLGNEPAGLRRLVKAEALVAMGEGTVY